MLRLGIIRGFDSLTYLADVEVEGYVSTYLQGVPVGYHVREDLVTDGTACLVAMLDPLNPRAAVVVALFDGRPGEDPRFDPVHGHRHRGLIGDGPTLS